MRRESNFSILSFKSRYEYTGVPREVSFEQMFKAFKTNVKRTKETSEEYEKGDKAFRDKCKDQGAFIMGKAKDCKRDKKSILNRNMITLDLDYCPSNILEEISENLELDFRFFVYSTHSHTKESPRLRIVVPLQKDVEPEEYEPIAHRLCGKFGLEYFDATTCQANRIMYFPSVSVDGEFICQMFNKDLDDLDGAKILEEYFDWKNIDEWQRPHYIEGKKRERLEANKGQDTTKTKYRMVNIFNIEYSITDALNHFLKDIYKEESNIRYTFIGGESRSGLHILNHQQAFSHHGSDPAQGRILNAFDIVRIHKFGEHDKESEQYTEDNYSKSSSYALMCEWIERELPNVMAHDPKRQEQNDVLVQALGEIGIEVSTNWLDKLVRDKHGDIKKLPHNIKLILQNDDSFQNLFFFDTIKQQVCFEKAPYWDEEINKGDGIRDLDFSHIRQHISSPPYFLTGKDTIDDGVMIEAYKKRVNYPKYFLSNLPEWDGVKRCEDIFIKLFGVDSSSFVREASKKWLTALVARIIKPGVKFDYVIALLGSVGIGKSTWGRSLICPDWNGNMVDIENYSYYFSDKELDLKNQRDTIDAIRGICVLELAEFDKFLTKYDKATLKSFITTNKDKFIERYGKRTIDVPRSFVMLATSNEMKPINNNNDDERRFLPFYCKLPKHKARCFDNEYWNREIRDQLLAEALHYYNTGYSFSSPFSPQQQKEWDSLISKASLENDSYGIVRDYIENKFDTKFLNWDIQTMQNNWRNEKSFDQVYRHYRNTFSIKEIYCVALNKRIGDKVDFHVRKDIEASLKKMGFEKVEAKKTFGHFGAQPYYIRKEDEELKLEFWDDQPIEEIETKIERLEVKKDIDKLSKEETLLLEHLLEKSLPF